MIRKINCIIIEDEPLAAEVMADYVTQINFLNLSGVFHRALDSIGRLQNEDIDLIFLDLHLPGIKGFDYLKTLSKPPSVIVTSAYPQYALEGYEHNVIDYLVKPIEFSRFVTAINKLREISSSNVPTESSESKLTFTVNRKKMAVPPSSIIYVESQRDYLTIHTKERKIRAKMTLGGIEQLLPQGHFIRIHKSFIVAKSSITLYDSKSVTLGDKSLPIGRNYVEHFRSQLN